MGKVYRLTEAELARACKKAYRLGARAAAEKFDRLLERMHRLKELNGSTEIFKHEWRESQHARNHGKFAPKGGGGSGGVVEQKNPLKTGGKPDERGDSEGVSSSSQHAPIPEAHLLEGLHAHVPAGSWAKVKDAVTRAAKRVHERLVLATPAILKLTDLLTTIESPDDLKVLGYTPVSGGVSGHQTPDALREATGIPGTIGAKLAAHVLSRVVHWMNRGASPEEAVGKALAEVRALAVRKAAAHAPKGGVSVQGKQYAGGEFIPAEVMANATDEEKAKVAGGGGKQATDVDGRGARNHTGGMDAQRDNAVPDAVRESVVREVVGKDYPDAREMSLSELQTEFDLSEWKDEIDAAIAIRTPEFKEWFGDWQADPKRASKVVNPDTGEPIAVYHATEADFGKFEAQSEQRAGDPMSKLGAWFAADRDIVKRYGTREIKSYLNIRKPLNLSVSDVMEWDDESGGIRYTMTADDLRDLMNERGADGIIFRAATAAEDESLGLDGEWDSPQFVVMSMDQIRIVGDRRRQPGQD